MSACCCTAASPGARAARAAAAAPPAECVSVQLYALLRFIQLANEAYALSAVHSIKCE